MEPSEAVATASEPRALAVGDVAECDACGLTFVLRARATNPECRRCRSREIHRWRAVPVTAP